MRVKICGITNIEDALVAIKAGADALGFVFYEKSPRYIEPSKALKIVKQLPPFVEKVGLFVNCTAKEISSTCRASKMSLAQIHFEAEDELYENLDIAYVRVIRATCRDDLLKYSDKYRIVDAFVEGYGGEGKRVDLSWFEGIDCSKIILAGGLSCNNIDEVKKLGFYALDISSGVEKSKGVKDSKKVYEFIKRANN